MNIDRGQENFTDEEVRKLQRDLRHYKDHYSVSWDKLAKQIGDVGGSTLGLWCDGKYTGDNQRVAYKVNKWFLAEEARAELEQQAPIVPGFLFTRTAREIHAQCRWAQRGKLVIAVGTAGVGKTAALKQYAATTPNTYRAEMSYGSRSPRFMLIELLHSMGVTSRGGGSVQTLLHVIADRIVDTNALLIADEAQHLTDDALDLVRHLHDRIGVGILLSGNPEVLTRIGARKAGFAQIHSRVSLPHNYDRPYAEDVAIICDAWGVKHPMEREFLARIAALPGCLRNVTQTLELATLTARGEDQDRTLDHIKQAWAQHSQRPLAA